VNLEQLTETMGKAGVSRLYAKRLSPNDNSKNQIYLGQSFEVLHLLPVGEIEPRPNPRTPTLGASIPLSWLMLDGRRAMAPHSKLILYPNYPEVRLSGFLRECQAAPTQLMNTRVDGRVLFLGVRAGSEVIAFAAGPESACVGEFEARFSAPMEGVFVEVPMTAASGASGDPARLLRELRRVHEAGWIDSKQLGTNGAVRPCNAPQCGGYTLEAELGIAKNGRSEPDFDGWEVKQHAVSSLDSSPDSKPITLLTPEPSGGYYTEHGVSAFIRKYGYPDKHGRERRINFGGIYRVGTPVPATSLRFRLQGFDVALGRVTDADGAIQIVDEEGNIAAAWSFAKLFEHWSRKHAFAVYVPAEKRPGPVRQYRFGRHVRLAEHTDGIVLLRAIANGAVYYDPGIKLEFVGNAETVKRRSQFRVQSKALGQLYRSIRPVDVVEAA
jgi:hypothetical protein